MTEGEVTMLGLVFARLIKLPAGNGRFFPLGLCFSASFLRAFKHDHTLSHTLHLAQYSHFCG